MWVGCLLFVALLLGNPALAAPPAAESAQVLFPLKKEGVRWRYAYRGDFPGGRSGETFELSFRGMRRAKGIEHALFIIDEVTRQGTSPTGYFFRDGFLLKVLGLAYDEQGEVVWLGEQSSRELGFASGNLEKFLPETITVGARWQSRTPVLNAQVETDYYVAGREEVEVPAGRYRDCFRVDSTVEVRPLPPPGEELPQGSTPQRYISSDWYAAGIGLVRTQVRTEGKKDAGEIVLLSYDEGTPPQSKP